MKRILAVSLGFVIIMSVIVRADEERLQGFDEKMEALFMRNYFSQYELDEMYQERIDSFNNEIWPGWLSFIKEGRVPSDEYDNEYEKLYDHYYKGLDYENGFKITILNTYNYMSQYAEEGKLKYLFSDEYYWAVFGDNIGTYYYDKNGRYYTGIREIFCDGYNNFDAKKDIRDMIIYKEDIKHELISMGIKQVKDIRLLCLLAPTNISLMYFETDAGEYLMKLVGGGFNELLPSIKKGKIYRAEDVMKAIEDKTESRYPAKQDLVTMVEKEKNLFEAEAGALFSIGMLKGNENGLDLLKPLTRAEAVTLLVRALGEEDQTVQYTASAFSDIASDNWAAPYVSLAKAKGIAAGVSETEFAPDNKVTSDQFAAFVLRAAGETNVDYTQAAQLLIDRGIITAEEAETMDLFTRGDMAKIIYEAREKGLLK